MGEMRDVTIGKDGEGSIMVFLCMNFLKCKHPMDLDCI